MKAAIKDKFKDIVKENDNLIQIQCENDSENLQRNIMQRLREGAFTSFNDFRIELENIEKEFEMGKPQH